MIEATSCGGVVIYRGKILALYKSYKNRYEGWVLPKGTVELVHIQLAWLNVPGNFRDISRLLYERCVKKQESKLP